MINFDEERRKVLEKNEAANNLIKFLLISVLVVKLVSWKWWLICMGIGFIYNLIISYTIFFPKEENNEIRS